MDANGADLVRQRMLEELTAEDPLLVKLVEAIPDDKLTWKPDNEKCWTANSLAFHPAVAGFFFLGMVDGVAPPEGGPPPAPEDKAELIAAIQTMQQGFRLRVAEYTPEQLLEERDFMGKKFSALEILSWHPRHCTHHRGQLALYLRLMGAKVPSTYGPSGDEEYSGG